MAKRTLEPRPLARSTDEVLARFRLRRLRAEMPAHPEPETDLRADYQEAAAVLHVFALPQLRPLRAATGGDAVAQLIDDTVPAVGWSREGFRSLKLNVRRAALRRLGSRDQLRHALDANPDRPRTDVQHLFERWLESPAFDLAGMSAQELQDLRALADWGLEVFAGFPNRPDIDSAWQRRSLTAPFEALAGSFVGRQSELQQLREFVGLSERSLWSRAEAFFSGTSSSFLMLQGQGGVGKTALIARFILDYFDNPQAARFAFMYLAFDDLTLDPREPFTLVYAMGRQLESQIAADPEASADSHVNDALAVFRAGAAHYLDIRETLGRRATMSKSQAARLTRLRDIDDDIQEDLIRLLRALSLFYGRQGGSVEAPALLVLDTFEEVEFRPDRDLKLFWRFINRLSTGLPLLRIVLSGRGTATHDIAGRRPQILKLGDLPREEAIALLTGLGVAKDAAAQVARQIGTDPLTLKVAARALKDDGSANALSDIKTTKYGFIRLGADIIRGQLYRRLLQHIHDPDVRSLAHPGMALRRVTPDIIRTFLASECGLGEVTERRAEDLFNALRREHTLVRLDETGALRYREEIRGSMLALLNADRPEEVLRLHRLAADYYADGRDAVSRAEEIYHLLMLETDDKSRLAARWGDDLERSLAASSEELPPSSRVWLAQMMNIKVPDDVIKRGRADELERIAGRQIGRAFRLGEFDTVLQILRELPPLGPASPLQAAKARALIATGRFAEALDGLDSAIAQYPPLGNQARLAELMWLTAQVAVMRQEGAIALNWLERLCDVARPLASRIPLIQALAEILGMADVGITGVDAGAVRDDLAAALLALKRDEGARERSLLRLALARLGPRPFEPWQRWAAKVAVDLLTSIRNGTTVVSGDSVDRLRGILAVSGNTRLASLGETLSADRPDGIADAAEAMLKELDRAEPDAAAFAGLAEIFKAEDSSLAASTLGGIEDSRESWEAEGGPEALA